MSRSLMRLAAFTIATLFAVACGGSSKQAELPRRLYACDDTSPNSVSAYTVATDGTLTPLDGSPFLTGGEGSGYGGQSNCIRIHVASRRLYAVNHDSVSIFSIDERTGGLTLLPGSPSPVAEGRTPELYSLEISADGNTVFLPDTSSNQVIVASVAADGSLTEIPGSPFATTGGASVAELGLGGDYLYVQPELNYVDAFQVASDKSLSLLSGSPYTYDPSDDGWTLRISPGGDMLAVGTGGMSVFTLDASTGVPTLAAGAPFSGPGSVGALSWTPDGARLYAGDWDSGITYGWSVAADGVLTPLSGSPWTNSLSEASAMAFSSDGSLLFVASESDEAIAVFTVDADGAPTEITGSPFTASSSDVSHLIFTP